ncbi:response regulator [Flavobacterium amnicola]|uniref:histidine kinase n=1 Tax=Flavobacterium amnicola TaxID=2506422 RepID=A0A4Q1K1T5_9FLAO|nr:ATP-binding protein [Flavobacterium amnicola]RXR18423.1 response regulator [Flavobacterium amnicola]
MTKINKLSIYYKLLLLIVVSSISFILLFVSLFYYTMRQEYEVYEMTQKQLDNEVNSLMKLNSESHISTINDITYWDELVKYIKSKNQKWFTNTIASAIDMYFVEYLGVFDLNGNEVGNKYTNKIKTPIQFIDKPLLDALHQKKNLNFYIKLPEGNAEVFMATIHPSSDPNKTKTNPEGYFVMIRLLDKDYLKKLEEISTAKITFSDSVDKKTNLGDTIEDIYVLKSWKGEAVASLIFQRKFYVNYKATENILFIILGFFIIFLFVYVIFLRKWVSTPLLLTTKILETGNRKAIKKLKSSPGEFSRIGNLFDETFLQRKQLEKAKAKAEESDQLKTAFLTNLSHEIRTPMNAIIGFSELLKSDEISNEEKKEYIEIINKSGGSLVSIIDDLIEMSKIDSNQITPNLNSVNIEECISEIYSSVKITIPKDKKIDFKLIKSETVLPYNVYTDVVKLKQVLINLLTNSIKFTDHGFITISYDWSKKKNNIEFTVEDSGLGIEKENQEFIFERFRRVDGDYSIKVGGLGLGLAITKAYVELLGGTISLKSEIGEGSKFKFTLPLMFDKREDILLEKIEVAKENVSMQIKDKTILIAEDDNINYLLFEKLMKNTNFTIIRAKDGEEAVELFKKNAAIDLVLMDIKMPKMSGYEALDKIKAINPKMMVIAQTAYSSSDEIEKIRLAGFDSQITKPIDKQKLFDHISASLQ